MIRVDVRRKGNSTSDATVDLKHVSTLRSSKKRKYDRMKLAS